MKAEFLTLGARLKFPDLRDHPQEDFDASGNGGSHAKIRLIAVNGSGAALRESHANSPTLAPVVYSSTSPLYYDNMKAFVRNSCGFGDCCALLAGYPQDTSVINMETLAQEFLWFRRLLWVANKTRPETHVDGHGGSRSGIHMVSATVVGWQRDPSKAHCY